MISSMISESPEVHQTSFLGMKDSENGGIYGKNIDAVRRLLGHSSVTATSSYIGVTDNSALDLARTYSF